MENEPTAPSTVQTNRQPNDPPPRETSLTSSSPTTRTPNNSIITLRAGPASFQVRSSLLPQTSRFFTTALNPSTQHPTSTPLHTIDFPQFSLHTVRLYADYLYERRLIDLPCTACPYQGCCPSPAAMMMKTHRLVILLVDAYLLSVRVEDYDFTRVVAARLQREVQETPGYFPRASTMEYVFERTQPGAAIRRLFCDAVRRWLAGSGYRSLEEMLAGREREEREEVMSILRRVEGERQRHQGDRVTR